MTSPLRLESVRWGSSTSSLEAARLADKQDLGSFPLTAIDSDEHFFHSLTCEAPATGTLVLEVVAPRPFRIWAEPGIIADEPLFWRSFQREVRAAVFLPVVSAGALELTFEFGPRPDVPEFVTEDCPSRNREKVSAGLKKLFPEELSLTATLHPATSFPPLSLRFLPGQFREDGVTWQEVVALVHEGGDTAPSTKWRHCREAARPHLTLTTTAWPAAQRDGSTPAEQIGGIRRLYVPVTAPGGEIKPLRSMESTEPEARLEPRLEVASTTALQVAFEDQSIRLDLPVYESLGRLAPVREFQPLRVFPSVHDADIVLDKLPDPILPASLGHYRTLYREAWRMLLRLVKTPRPESGLPGSFISTGAGFSHYQFLWDTSFTTLATAYGWRELPAQAGLDLLLSRQHDGGYIHRETDTRDGLPALYEPDFSPNPPLLALAEWRLHTLSGDRARLHRVYPALVAYHQWLVANRRLPNGTYWTTGLANGLDNSPSLGDGYPDLTAQMAHDAEHLAFIADALGHRDAAAAWRREQAEILTVLNEHLWSDSLQFYSTSLKEGGHNPNKVVTGFWPLWAGAADQDRTESLARHLKDPASFWRHSPIPSLAADAPLYETEGCYWLGSSWAPTNHAVVKGFQRAGRRDLAVEVTLRQLEVMHEVFQKTGKIWENYAPDKSAPGNWSGPDYCWSALAPIAGLLEIVIGLEPDAPNRTLSFSPPPKMKIGVERYPLGDRTIDLVQKPSNAGDQVEVRTDRPFTLLLCRGTASRPIHCPAGSSTHFWPA